MIILTEKKTRTISLNQLPSDAWTIYNTIDGGLGPQNYVLSRRNKPGSVKVGDNLLDAVFNAFKATQGKEIYYSAGRFGYAKLTKNMSDNEISDTIFYIGIGEATSGAESTSKIMFNHNFSVALKTDLSDTAPVGTLTPAKNWKEYIDYLAKNGSPKGKPVTIATKVFDVEGQQKTAYFVYNYAVSKAVYNYALSKGIAKGKPPLDESRITEATNLPAIAKVAGVATSSPITKVVRQSTVLATLEAAGYDAYVNKMNNVVCPVKDMADAGAVLQTIYQEFGLKGSFMVTWEGKGKLYFDPKTPIDKAPALAYAKTAGLPAPNFTKLLA